MKNERERSEKLNVILVFNLLKSHFLFESLKICNGNGCHIYIYMTKYMPSLLRLSLRPPQVCHPLRFVCFVWFPFTDFSSFHWLFGFPKTTWTGLDNDVGLDYNIKTSDVKSSELHLCQKSEKNIKWKYTVIRCFSFKHH